MNISYGARKLKHEGDRITGSNACFILLIKWVCVCSPPAAIGNVSSAAAVAGASAVI
jgi:hypothetical protein